jgi:hypothetical protein
MNFWGMVLGIGIKKVKALSKEGRSRGLGNKKTEGFVKREEKWDFFFWLLNLPIALWDFYDRLSLDGSKESRFLVVIGVRLMNLVKRKGPEKFKRSLQI